MSPNDPATAAPAAALPSPDEVTTFLRRHPDFLAERPELLQDLTPPSRFTGEEPVADFQAAMIRGLRQDIARLSRTSDDLLTMSRSNLTQQQRTHTAALRLVEATTPADFHRVLIHEWPRILDVDAIALILEDPSALGPHAGPEGIARVPLGTVDRLMAKVPAARVILTPERYGNTLFGEPALRVRSDALARLDEPATWEPGGSGQVMPAGLLALGSFQVGTFHPDQATDLLEFLTRLLAIVLSRWCAPTL